MRCTSLARRIKAALAITALGCLAMAGMSPDSLTATLPPGGSVSETKTVTVSRTFPKADIVFAFDLTGSMGEELDVMQAQAIQLMADLGALVDDPHFAVIGFVDYPHTYPSGENGGYGGQYGGDDDYAYRLEQPLTDDTDALNTVIGGLELGYGADGPQDYARICYESYADETIGYRPGSKKILILFGDDIPHDLDLNTGRDPGRDEEINTGDDLDWDQVLEDMADKQVTLLSVHSGFYDTQWKDWAAITGGYSYELTDADDIPMAILDLVEDEASHIDLLTLAVDPPEYAGWLTSVDPTEYTDIDIPEEGSSFDFDITLTVPADAASGLHEFDVVALGDGAEYGRQTVEIRVNSPPDCSLAAPSVATLWPPDHKAVDVTVLGVTDPDGDAITITIDGITQDEPVNGLGDGDQAPDGGGLATSTAWLRAERSGTGNGRVYVISFTASDPWGGTCSGTVAVSVPPSQKKGVTATDDGQSYDSTTE